MELDLLDLYGRASAWTGETVVARAQTSMRRRSAKNGTFGPS